MTWRSLGEILPAVLGTIDISDIIEAAFREYGVETTRNTAAKNTVPRKRSVRRAKAPRHLTAPPSNIERTFYE